MNIYIEGKQSDIPKDLQQRTKRALSVLKDIGFDIKLRFSEPEEDKYVLYLPCFSRRDALSVVKELEISTGPR